MYNAFTNANYPYYGQPYHTYIPPGYTQPPPRPNFNSAPSAFSPSHSSVDPWTREKMTFPQSMGLPPTRPPPSSQGVPFIPPNPDAPNGGHPPTPRLKRASTTKHKPVTEKPPLKSAMKKSGVKRADTITSMPLERTRTNSSARQRMTPMTRTRTNSNPSFLPDHMTLLMR